MYYQRKLELELKLSLEKETDNQILLIVGARQTGKTTLLKYLFNEYREKYSSFFINLENPEYQGLLNKHPDNLFKIVNTPLPKGRNFIFIDEIQYLKDPTNFLKYIYDEYNETIKLIVSGSSSFYIDRKFRDSLAGRKKIFYLYSLNFGEFLKFKNQNQLIDLLHQKKDSSDKKLPLIVQKEFEALFSEYIRFGGYPAVVLAETIEEKKTILENITFDYQKKDFAEANLQDEEKYFHLIKILANQCGQLVNINHLAGDLSLSHHTIENYLYVLQKSFHIALIKPFYRNVRKELIKMRKVFFYDLGIRNQFLNNFQEIDFREDKGQFLENIFFKEMLSREKVDNIRYWRTPQKHEVDFIIKEEKAYEIKFQEKDIKKSKYKMFLKQFPAIPLEFATYEKIKEKFLEL